MNNEYQDPYKLLIITSSGGGGLLKAADAQEQEAIYQNPEVQIFKRDVMKDWVWKWLGDFSVKSWNKAQKKGCVRSQKFFVNFHRLFDIITWPSIFLHTLRILTRENIDRVIDTQTTSMHAVIQAIRVFNWKCSKHLFLEKLVVDLPTKKATHFFRPIKALSRKGKKFLKVRTIAPLLDEGQTREMFWQTHCGLSDSEVFYEDVNVRRPFRALQGVPRKDADLSFHFLGEKEFSLMEKCFSKGTLSYVVKEKKVTFSLPRNVQVVTILLGSQPAGNSTLNYVKHFVEIARNLKERSSPIALFVFCGEFHPKKEDLFHKVVKQIQNTEDYPSALTVIPFTFQKDEVIAPLFHRSDITCSRSGGQTAMELMAVSTGEIWIHSESRKKNPTLKDLLKGIPMWESESAFYLYRLNNAKIVTPSTFSPIATQLFMK